MLLVVCGVLLDVWWFVVCVFVVVGVCESLSVGGCVGGMLVCVYEWFFFFRWRKE